MNFKDLITKEDLVLVDFYATWCGPCKALAPELVALKSMQKDNLKIVKIDVDKNPGASAKMGVKGVPTLILFKNGIVKWRQSGVVSAAELNQIINQYYA